MCPSTAMRLYNLARSCVLYLPHPFSAEFKKGAYHERWCVWLSKIAPVHSYVSALSWTAKLRASRHVRFIETALGHDQNSTLINTWSLCCGSLQNATPRRYVSSSRPERWFLCQYWNRNNRRLVELREPCADTFEIRRSRLTGSYSQERFI
jgi:hypothetical protein